MDARNYDLPVQSDYADVSVVSGARPAIGPADVIGTLRREWRLPVVGCLIGLIGALAYVGTISLPYKSSARILIDRSVNRYLQTNNIVDQPTFDEPEIGSQVYVLSSDSVVVPVVRSMNLTRDGEFVGAPRVGAARIPELFGELKEMVKRLAGLGPAPENDSKATLERAAVEAVVKRIAVTREDVANVINVSFESEDANKAAAIANALADTYVVTTLEGKLKSTKIVSEWLQERLLDLKTQANEADQALRNYRVAHNLPNISTQSAEQRANLNTQLTNAQIATAEAKSRLDRILQRSGEAITTTVGTDGLMNVARAGVTSPGELFSLNNNELIRLRAQYRELASRAADVESRVGTKHAVAVKLRRQADGLGAAIRAEEARIADSYANEYQVAKAREAELAASAARAFEGTEASSKLRELESSAEALRTLYESTLQKFKAINTIQTETMPVQNARIITRAVPASSRNSKKALAVMAGTVMFGLFLGVGAAVGREYVADVFRTRAAVEQVTGTHCVVLPMVTSKALPIEEYVLEVPYSRFTETLRIVKALLDSVPSADGARILGVVSSVPNEGKTMLAANLAALTAASGARTLIIDSDLHLRKLTSALAPAASGGLIEALEEPARLAMLVTRRPSGLDVLPCAASARIPNAAELLGSPRMQRLLETARKSYEYIIIEIAPVMSVVDAKVIERFIDGFVFVVAWGETRRSLVVDALTDVGVMRERLLGIVLNKADPLALQNGHESSDPSGDYYRS